MAHTKQSLVPLLHVRSIRLVGACSTCSGCICGRSDGANATAAEVLTQLVLQLLPLLLQFLLSYDRPLNTRQIVSVDSIEQIEQLLPQSV